MIQYKSDPSLYRKTTKSEAKNLLKYVAFIAEHDMELHITQNKTRAPLGAAYTPRYQ